MKTSKQMIAGSFSKYLKRETITLLAIPFLLSLLCVFCLQAKGFAQPQMDWAQANTGTSGTYTKKTYYTVGGGGAGLASTSDNFSFARVQQYLPVTLQAVLTAAPSAGFAGIMARTGDDASSAHVTIGLSSSNVVTLIVRQTASGSTTTTTGATISGPIWFRILETANSGGNTTLAASYSTDGSSWTQVGSSVTFGTDNFFEGFAVASGTSGVMTKATFSNFSIESQPTRLDEFLQKDLGSPGIGGLYYFDYAYTGGGSGEGVLNSGSADSLNLAYQQVSGDFEMTVKVLSQTSSDSDAFAGIAVRDSFLTANGVQATLGLTPSSGIRFVYRATAGGTNSQATLGSISAPTWLRLKRTGLLFEAYQSGDGVSWTQVGSGQTLNMPKNVYLGFATASGGLSVNTSSFDHVSVWSGEKQEDIGSPGATGTLSYDPDTNTYTIEGAGTGIYGSSDSFNYTNVAAPGIFTATTYVGSQENTDANAYAGLMMRDPSGGMAAIGVTPSNGVKFVYRQSTSGSSTTVTTASIAAPRYLRLVRAYNVMYGYQSSDGSSWALVGRYEGIVNHTASDRVGFAVASNINGTLSTATFQQTALSIARTFTPIDVGTTGTYSYNGGTKTYTVTGEGILGGSADTSNFVRGGVIGNTEVYGKVASQSNTNAYSAAGFMFRETRNAGSRMAAITVSPSNGVNFTYRYTADQPAVTIMGPTVSAPVYLRLVRSAYSSVGADAGYAIAGYYSTDGSNWQLVGKCRLPFASTSFFAGFTVNSQAAASSTTATFTEVYCLNKVFQRDANTVQWLRADAGVVSSGGSISKWLDQSERGNNAYQTTGANQPSLLTGQSGNNYLPTVNFSGSPERLELGSDFKTFSSAAFLTLMTPKTTYTSGARLFDFSASGNTDNIGISENNTSSSSGDIRFHVKNGSTDSYATATGALGAVGSSYFLGAFHFGGNYALLWVDGTYKSTTWSTPFYNISSTMRTVNRMGSDSANSNFYVGDVSEMFVFDTSNPNLTNLQEYLNSKYSRGSVSTLLAPIMYPQWIVSNTERTVTLTPYSADSVLYYTTDGTTPTTASNLYTGTFTVSEPTVLKAIAVQPHYNTSPVTEGFVYVDLDSSGVGQPNLVSWYRADKRVTSSSGSVSDWKDLSGNEYNWAQATGGSQPSTSTLSGGLDALSFDGSADFLAASTLSNINYSSGMTIFIVAEPSTIGTPRPFFDFGGGGTANNISMQEVGASGLALYVIDGASSTNVTAASGAVSTATQILEALHDGSTTATLFTNGVQKASGTVNDIPNSSRPTNNLGKAVSSGDYYSGKIAEVIIYNGALTSTQRGKVEAYLKQRYGL